MEISGNPEMDKEIFLDDSFAITSIYKFLIDFNNFLQFFIRMRKVISPAPLLFFEQSLISSPLREFYFARLLPFLSSLK